MNISSLPSKSSNMSQRYYVLSTPLKKGEQALTLSEFGNLKNCNSKSSLDLLGITKPLDH